MTNLIVQAASPPALAKNARTGHPLFRNGKEEHGKLGHPPVPASITDTIAVNRSMDGAGLLALKLARIQVLMRL
jgi:hypothetical protein